MRVIYENRRAITLADEFEPPDSAVRKSDERRASA